MSRGPYIGPFLGQPVAARGRASATGQNASISAQPLLGGNTVRGTYRVSAAISVQTRAGSGDMLLVIKCTGENGVVNEYALPFCSASGPVGDAQSDSFLVSADGSGDITYQVEFSGVPAASVSYTYRVTAEQVQT